MASQGKNIVVVGAGVAGLTTALLLSKRGHNVTVVAKHVPGDYDIEYTSPWAGANFMPVSFKGTPEEQWDRDTFKELWRLATEVPEAGIEVQDTFIYTRGIIGEADERITEWLSGLLSVDPWFRDLVPEFRVLTKPELPPGITTGTAWKSVCINTALYLPYLVSQCLKHHTTFKRAALTHITQAATLHSSGPTTAVDIVVNCTGLNARFLGGVQDKAVLPMRGQIAIVRNEAPAMYFVFGVDDLEDETTYIMTRVAGGGTIIGGCYQVDSWSSQPDPNQAQRMMKRAIDICPELVNPGQGVEGLDVVRHTVGLRPYRIGGPRLEKELIGGVRVVHNYGAGGFGYQASYGMSGVAVKLVEEFLGEEA